MVLSPLASLDVDFSSKLCCDEKLNSLNFASKLGEPLLCFARCFSSKRASGVRIDPVFDRTKEGRENLRPDQIFESRRLLKNLGEIGKHIAKIPHVVSAMAHKFCMPAK